MSKVPIVKIFTMGDCMAAQRRCENSSFEHAHYGALRCVTGAYRPVKGVRNLRIHSFWWRIHKFDVGEYTVFTIGNPLWNLRIHSFLAENTQV